MGVMGPGTVINSILRIMSAAALAMYKCAKTDRQKEVEGLLISAALTAMITGITEPIEFTFLFVAPFLNGLFFI